MESHKQPGRPKGTGQWQGRETTVIRVPVDEIERIRGFLTAYESLRSDFDSRKSKTRNWTQYNRFCKCLDLFIPPRGT